MLGRDRRQRRRRVAAVGAAGVAAKKHHDAKQAERGEAAPEPAPTEFTQEAAAGDGLSPEALNELKQLGALHEEGVLTDAEFEAEKAKLLGARS